MVAKSKKRKSVCQGAQTNKQILFYKFDHFKDVKIFDLESKKAEKNE